MMETLHLESWEYEHAANIGIRRFTANWGKPDAAHYDKKLMEDNRTAEVAAAVCELAVAKLTNRFWSGHVWHHSEHYKYSRLLADVGENIEVRRIRTPGKGAAVRKHQVGKGMFLFAAYAHAPEFTAVDIYGWLPMDEAWDRGTPFNQRDDMRYVATELMRPYKPTSRRDNEKPQ
jgi:hypothetical protein